MFFEFFIKPRYGIQGLFARFITGIKGDYYNVMGLPVARLYQELKDHGLL